MVKKKKIVKKKAIADKIVNKKVTNKPNVKKITAKDKEIIKIFNKEIDCKTYFEYYTLVIFFLFAILFISIIIIFVLALFGAKYLWWVIPVTLLFWTSSFYISKIIFKKTKKK